MGTNNGPNEDWYNDYTDEELESYYQDLYEDYKEAFDEWDYSYYDYFDDMYDEFAGNWIMEIMNAFVDGPSYGS